MMQSCKSWLKSKNYVINEVPMKKHMQLWRFTHIGFCNSFWRPWKREFRSLNDERCYIQLICFYLSSSFFCVSLPFILAVSISIFGMNFLRTIV